MKKRFLVIAGLLLPFFSAAASACTCGWERPCEAYAKAQSSFVGQVINSSVRTIERHWPGDAVSATYTSFAHVAKLKVIEAFHGVTGSEIEIAGTGTNCDVPFEEGKTYVVYAYENSDDRTLYTDICSRTGPISETKEDLDYLKRTRRFPDGATAFGIVSQYEPPLGTRGHEKPIVGGQVVFKSAIHKYAVVTDKRGHYIIRGLPKGTYLVYTNPPTNDRQGYGFDKPPEERWNIEIPDRGCVPMWFTKTYAGRLSGQVLSDSSINEPPNVELIPFDRKLAKRGIGWDREPAKNNQGRFEFWHIPPGQYYLGFNIAPGETNYPDFQRSYYPGVPDRRYAKVITIRKNQRLTGFVLKIPTRTITQSPNKIP